MTDSKIIQFIEAGKADATSNLHEHSWVSPTFKYFFFGMGKTASTRIKLSLHMLEGYPVVARPFPWLHAREMADVPFVPTLTAFEMEEAVAVLTSADWFRFCFVRNPYNRLFAAYKFAIMQEIDPPSPYYNRIKDRIRTMFNYEQRIDSGRFQAQPTITFRDFVLYVEETMEEDPDYHWCTVTGELKPALIDYDFVGRVENFDEDFTQVLQHLGVDAARIATLLEPVNRSTIRKLPLAAVYDWALADHVYEIYKADFERYGYEKNSWLFEHA